MNKNSVSTIESAFILGSTSTVAKAICLELAKNHKCKRFHFVSRNPEKDQELIDKLNNQYSPKTDHFNQVSKVFLSLA